MSSGTATVVSCAKLKDTEWISRQDPYVCLEYASTKFRIRTCTDGGKHLVFQEKFVVPLIKGLREFTVVVWNSNILTFDGFIGTGKVQLNKVLSQGFDDSSWPLQTKSGRHAGEVKLILHSANAKLNQQKLDSSSTHVATTPTAPSSSSFLKPPFKLLLTFSATHYTPSVSTSHYSSNRHLAIIAMPPSSTIPNSNRHKPNRQTHRTTPTTSAFNSRSNSHRQSPLTNCNPNRPSSSFCHRPKSFVPLSDNKNGAQTLTTFQSHFSPSKPHYYSKKDEELYHLCYHSLS
ncbi:hypothetical protein RYX36_008126 [Vicia faba]